MTNIKHYIDDDESGRFFDRSAYVQMMEDIENGKVGIVIMKDMTRWGRYYLQVGNAMEVFRRNNVRFIPINNGIDSAEPWEQKNSKTYSTSKMVRKQFRQC